MDSVKLYFCRLHCKFFYSENQIIIFSGLICPKSHLRNKIPFFDKKRGLILLESFIFWTFLKVFLSCLKTTLFYWEYLKTIFLSLISKKQEAWTNPFGKFRLLGFFRNLAFSWLEFNIFYSQYWKIIFSCLICLKNTHEKRLGFFYKNRGLTPLENVYLLTLLKLFFCFKNRCFLFRITVNDIFLLDLPKNTHRRKSSFCWRKAWTNPLGKFKFFGLSWNLTFFDINVIYSAQNTKKWFCLAGFA